MIVVADDRLPRRFWSKVLVDTRDGCWVWTASRDRGGYGKFFWQGRHWIAHRYAYSTLVGPLVHGMEIDHICCNPSCVNTKHLDLVTPAENKRRKQWRRTHCPVGHTYTPSNTYITQAGAKVCRLCGIFRSRRKRMENRK